MRLLLGPPVGSFLGAVMRLRWSYAHTEAAAFLAACVILGGAMGALIALLSGWWETR